MNENEVNTQFNSQNTSSPKEPIISVEIVDTGVTTNEQFHQVNWFNIACRLRQQNRELLKRIVQLEQSLFDSQQQLQVQIRRFGSTQTLITQQAEEFEKTQKQVTHLLQELDVSRQVAQSQQIQIENFSKQLETTQEQMAVLERECALLQEEDHEKTQKLIAAEKQTRELSSRLHRQQRYTLQYKAALDQCLGTEGDRTSASSTPKISPIQPWSETLYNETTEPPLTSSNTQEIQSVCEPETLELTNNLEFMPTDSCEPESDTFLEDLEKPELNTHLPNWPSLIITQISPIKKHGSKPIDLPAFLRDRANPT